MSVTFGNNPAGSNLDLVRVLINDTTGRLSDETINYFLTSEASVWYAAAMCAETIGGQYSQTGDLTVGDLSIRRSVVEYRNLAKQLRARGSRGAVPFAGGMTQSAKLTETLDTDRVPPAFTIGMHDEVST
jgi:hypothetical protein